MSLAAHQTTQQENAPPYRLLPRLHSRVKELLNQQDLLFNLMEKYGSPLNLLLPEIFAQKHKLFEDVLTGEHLKHRLYFTCKPNRSNALLRQAAQIGSWVDVSSAGELQAALDAGVPGNKISATGPKNKAYLTLATQHRALVVADNLQELASLATIAQQDQPVMIRLSTPQEAPARDDTFGVAPADIPACLSQLIFLSRLKFVGFAIHTDGDADTRQHFLEHLVTTTLAAFEAGLSPQAINIGGGYKVCYVESATEWEVFQNQLRDAVLGQGEPITWDNNGMGLRLQLGSLAGTAGFIPHYEAMTAENHLQNILLAPIKSAGGISLAEFVRDTGFELFIEPGRGLLDQVGLTLARVDTLKRSAHGHWLVNIDMHHANLNAHNFKYMAEPLILSHAKNDAVPNKEGVFYNGSLCMLDLITFHKTYPEKLPQPGDIVVFANTAAYRMDFAESEILRHPNAAKIAVFQQGDAWHHVPDNDYRPEQSA